MMGVCIHPKYGGWFALRTVIIVKTLRDPTLPRVLPIDVLREDSKLIIELLERFNDRWQDSTYRNIIPVEETYSELQQSYFSTLPKDRFVWLQNLRLNQTNSLNHVQQ